MVMITYVQPDGVERTIDVPEGRSVMEGAVANDVPGILAECGGSCSCATCHAYIDEKWIELVGPPGEDEADMLEFANGPTSGSRLTCQIEVTAVLDGLRLAIPEEQG